MELLRSLTQVPLSWRQRKNPILSRYTKCVLYCLIIGSLIIVSGCSAGDSSGPDEKNESARPSTNQSSNVNTEPSAAQNSNAEQKQGADEAGITVRELVDLITVADVIDEYVDRYYYIVGKIEEIELTDDRGTLILEEPILNGTGAATFIFEPPPDGFEDLRVGQVIKLRGYLDGPMFELMVHLYFLDCELIAVGPLPEEQKDDQSLPNGDGEIPQNNDDYIELTADSPNLPVNLSEPFGYYEKADGLGGFSIDYISDDGSIMIEYYSEGQHEYYGGQWVEADFHASLEEYLDFSSDNVLEFIDSDGNSVLRFDAYESYITITASEPLYGVTVDRMNGDYYCKVQFSILQ